MQNRIKKHIKIRAGDIIPHDLNPRTHTDGQRQALTALYEEIGFARSLLAYELPDGRLKLIDGHLRQSMTPDEIVDVEVLDVNDAEARALLLAIDPLAQLAGYDAENLAKLREVTEQDSVAIQTLWQAITQSEKEVKKKLKREIAPQTNLPEQYLVLIECDDETEQVELLRRFKKEGLKVTAKIA